MVLHPHQLEERRLRRRSLPHTYGALPNGLGSPELGVFRRSRALAANQLLTRREEDGRTIFVFFSWQDVRVSALHSTGREVTA